MIDFKRHLKIIRGRLYKFNIKVMDNEKTVDFILKNSSSVIRFGDGEFDIIRGKSIPYQNYDPQLASKLFTLVLKNSTKKMVVCLPDVFTNMSRYTKVSNSFYYEYFFYQNRNILRDIEKRSNHYGSTFLSRPYIDLKDKKI